MKKKDKKLLIKTRLWQLDKDIDFLQDCIAFTKHDPKIYCDALQEMIKEREELINDQTK